MTARTFTVHNKSGLHARPATLFVQTAVHFKALIKVTREGRTVDAKSILGVLSLGAGKNSVIEVEAEGADETAALDALETLLTTTIGEEECAPSKELLHQQASPSVECTSTARTTSSWISNLTTPSPRRRNSRRSAWRPRASIIRSKHCTHVWKNRARARKPRSSPPIRCSWTTRRYTRPWNGMRGKDTAPQQPYTALMRTVPSSWTTWPTPTSVSGPRISGMSGIVWSAPSWGCPRPTCAPCRTRRSLLRATLLQRIPHPSTARMCWAL